MSPAAPFCSWISWMSFSAALDRGLMTHLKGTGYLKEREYKMQSSKTDRLTIADQLSPRLSIEQNFRNHRPEG